MSESYEPKSNTAGGPNARPSGEGVPPKTGGGLKPPAAGDSVDPGMTGEGDDRGQDTGGMIGEG
jgi:hypothetical protein